MIRIVFDTYLVRHFHRIKPRRTYFDILLAISVSHVNNNKSQSLFFFGSTNHLFQYLYMPVCIEVKIPEIN